MRSFGLDNDQLNRLFLKWSNFLIFAGLIAAWTAFAVLILVAPIQEFVLRFIPDDGFYYLEIARRIGQGQGSTFDGITRTNGYHPLWTLMLVPLSHIMTVSRAMGLRLSILLGAVLMAGAFCILARLSEQLNRETKALAVAIPASMLMFSSIYGMESPLAVFLFAWMLWELQSLTLSPARWAQGFRLGFVSALLILSRLDTVVFVVCLNAVVVLLWWRSRRQGNRIERLRGAPILLCFGIQALAVLLFAAWNYIEFGHFITVSAALKAGRHDSPLFSWLYASWGGVPGIVSAILGVLALLAVREPLANPVLTTAASGTALYLLAIVVQGRGEVYHWYFTIPIFSSGLFVPPLIKMMTERLRRFKSLYVPLIAAAILLFIASVGRRLYHPEYGQKQIAYQMATWTASNSPPTAVFALTDCGLMAFFSERPCVNTDGLTCSFEFQESIRDRRVPEFLTAAGVNAIVTRRDRSPPVEPGSVAVLPIGIRQGIYGTAQPVHAIVSSTPVKSQGDFELWKILSLRPEL